MSVGDPNARYEVSHVRVKIKSAYQSTVWYAGLIGHVVPAERTVTTYTNSKDQYVKYTMFPDRHKHLHRDDVEEIEIPNLRHTPHLNNTTTKRKNNNARRKRERQNKRKARS